ncbi:MAG: DUF222 domain-containing protein [Acidimicrobiia bacterium]
MDGFGGVWTTSSLDWVSADYQSTDAWLRWQAGMRTADVRGAIDAGEVGELLPETRTAWRAGTITSGAMRAITAARVKGFDAELQGSEAEFLAAAKRKDMWSLQRLTARFRACAKRDGKLPPDRSGLRAAIVGDGLVLDGEIRGLKGETIYRVVNAFTDPPSPEDDRTHAERRADALYRICRVAMEAGVDANMASLSAVVVIDWSTLLEQLTRRHAPHSPAATVDLTGRMDGGFIGPLDLAEVETMLCNSPISRVVTGPNSEPIDVGRTRRIFPAAIRRAIVARDQHCRWPATRALILQSPGWRGASHPGVGRRGRHQREGRGPLVPPTSPLPACASHVDLRLGPGPLPSVPTRRHRTPRLDRRGVRSRSLRRRRSLRPRAVGSARMVTGVGVARARWARRIDARARMGSRT